MRLSYRYVVLNSNQNKLSLWLTSVSQFAVPMQNYHSEYVASGNMRHRISYQHYLNENNLSNEPLMQTLLYSDKDFTDGLNRDILLLTLCFIHKAGRLD